MKKINVSYSSDDLIEEVKEDILCFGNKFKIYAIYSWFPGVDKEFITDYIHSEKPKRAEVNTDSDYQKLIKDYNRSIETLSETKYKEMTLENLLKVLIKQNQIL